MNPNQPLECPECHSTNIRPIPVRVPAQDETQEAQCNNCHYRDDLARFWK